MQEMQRVVTASEYARLLEESFSYKTIVKMLLSSMDLDYSNKPYIPSTEATKVLKAFEPDAFKEKVRELLSEEEDA